MRLCFPFADDCTFPEMFLNLNRFQAVPLTGLILEKEMLPMDKTGPVPYSRDERDEHYRPVIRNFTMMSDSFLRNV